MTEMQEIEARLLAMTGMRRLNLTPEAVLSAAQFSFEKPAADMPSVSDPGSPNLTANKD